MIESGCQSITWGIARCNRSCTGSVRPCPTGSDTLVERAQVATYAIEPTTATESSVQAKGARDQNDMAAAKALWDELAIRARMLHCPQHYAQPWRVTVIGETPEKLRLYISGCCPQLGEAVNAMIRSEPRISGPR